MPITDSVFAGTIPKLYDELMVPMIFAPYATDMAARAAALAPQRVLETAAGTGAVTRALCAALPADCAIVATDINPPMLDQARAQGADPRVTWQHADALALPFAGGSFDLLVCQFGIMFFPDRIQGYREARRVLRPKGHFLFNVWDNLAGNDFVRVISAALALRFPGDPPKFMERTPHGHHDIPLIRDELAQAGFASVTVDAVERKSHAPSALAAATAYCQGTPLRAEIEARGGDLGDVTAEMARALTAVFGPDPIAGRIRASVVTAS